MRVTASRGSISTPAYRPAWWIPGAHLRTLWGRFARRSPHVVTQRERWTTRDDDLLDIERLDGPAGGPRLLILHGLEGSHRSHYARGLLDQARRRGWAADVLLFRTCGGALNRTLRSYHAGETGDLDFVARRLASAEPDRPLFITGVSLGGNVLLKWLGQCAGALPPQLRAAVAISTPYDLARGSRNIAHGFSRLYQAHFLRSLRRKALVKCAQFATGLDTRVIRRSRTLWQFDDAFTAPVHGFHGVRDYYDRSSAIRWIDRIRTPTLLISARDDPFLPADVLDRVRAIARANPLLELDFVDKGGHVGFIAGSVPWRPIHWAEQRAVDFLEASLAALPGGLATAP